MDMRDVFFKLPRAQEEVLRHIAAGRDVTVGQIIREAIAHEIRRSTRDGRGRVFAPEELLAPLRARLAADFAEARNWPDLQARLHAKGYVLREAGGGLALHSHPSGARLCKASELGYSYAKLMRRFHAPFPGHGHAHLARHVLGPDYAPDYDEDDVEVIEPF